MHSAMVSNGCAYTAACTHTADIKRLLGRAAATGGMVLTLCCSPLVCNPFCCRPPSCTPRGESTLEPLACASTALARHSCSHALHCKLSLSSQSCHVFHTYSRHMHGTCMSPLPCPYATPSIAGDCNINGRLLLLFPCSIINYYCLDKNGKKSGTYKYVAVRQTLHEPHWAWICMPPPGAAWWLVNTSKRHVAGAAHLPECKCPQATSSAPCSQVYTAAGAFIQPK